MGFRGCRECSFSRRVGECAEKVGKYCRKVVGFSLKTDDFSRELVTRFPFVMGVAEMVGAHGFQFVDNALCMGGQ